MKRAASSIIEDIPKERKIECTILDFTDDILLCICAWIDIETLDLSVPLVCKRFCRIARNETLWKKLCLAEWPSLSLLPPSFQFSQAESYPKFEQHSKAHAFQCTFYSDPLFPNPTSWHSLYILRTSKLRTCIRAARKSFERFISSVEKAPKQLNLQQISGYKQSKSLIRMCAINAMFSKRKEEYDTEELKFISESVVYKNITVSPLHGRGESQFETCVSGSVMNLQGKSIPFIVATNWRTINTNVSPDYKYLPIIEKMLVGQYEICTSDTITFTKNNLLGIPNHLDLIRVWKTLWSLSHPASTFGLTFEYNDATEEKLARPPQEAELLFDSSSFRETTL